MPAQIALDPSNENAIVVGRSRKEAGRVCLGFTCPGTSLLHIEEARAFKKGRRVVVRLRPWKLKWCGGNDARLHQERKLVEGDVVRFGAPAGKN